MKGEHTGNRHDITTLFEPLHERPCNYSSFICIVTSDTIIRICVITISDIVIYASAIKTLSPASTTSATRLPNYDTDHASDTTATSPSPSYRA